MSSNNTQSPRGLRLFILFLALFPIVGFFGNLFGKGCSGEESEYPKAAMTATNLKAALNKTNKARMKGFGIKLPDSIMKIGSSALFPEGEYTDGYSEFEERVTSVLQPENVVCVSESGNCHDIQVRGASTILSLSAIGVYQILLWHHGKALETWDDPTSKKWGEVDWEKNLHVIYEYMNSMDMQNTAFKGLINKLREECKGDPRQMASKYYSGSGTAWYDVGDWMPAQFGYGSKRHYSGIVKDCFINATGAKTVEDTPEHLEAYRICISKKETGSLHGGQAVNCPQSSLGIFEKYGSDKTCFVGDSYMAGIANGKGKSRTWSLKGKAFVPYVADKAKEVLEDEKCKLLVLNGGLNDMYGRSAEEIRSRVPDIKFRYEEVVTLARKKGVEIIVVYDVPLIKKSPCGKKGGDCDKKQAVEDATEEVNDFLDDDLDADYIIHTNDFIVGDDTSKWTKDGIHPKNYACLKGRL